MKILNNVSTALIVHASPIISDGEMELFGLVNNAILCGVVSIFGSIANVINMIVFYRQGLETPINISFFSLAVSDLCSLVFQQLHNVYLYPQFRALDLPIVHNELQFLTTAMTREMFARITCMITAFITAERCMCIVFPLHIKRIITPRVTTTVIIVIYVLTLSSPAPIYFTSYYTWIFYPHLNKTLLGLASTNYHVFAEAFFHVTHAFFTLLGFLSTLIFTLILIYNLRQKNVWRQTANFNQEKVVSLSKRDRATINVVILIAGILVVCYMPSVLLVLASLLEREFTIEGRLSNLNNILWSFAILFENINSSINICLYYKMSSKYKQTLRELLSGNSQAGYVDRVKKNDNHNEADNM